MTARQVKIAAHDLSTLISLLPRCHQSLSPHRGPKATYPTVSLAAVMANMYGSQTVYHCPGSKPAHWHTATIANPSTPGVTAPPYVVVRPTRLAHAIEAANAATRRWGIRAMVYGTRDNRGRWRYCVRPAHHRPHIRRTGELL